MTDKAYEAVASVDTDKFLVYQQKLADAAGKPVKAVVPSFQATFDRITSMGVGYTG
jgi:hypothetical protein